MPREWPKRCFSWPEEALLTNDEDFIYLPRHQRLRGWQDVPESRQNAAKSGRQKADYYRFTTFGEIVLGI